MGFASSSSSSSSSSSLPYDVFLSFRGQDTRESFVCHLHKALERKTLKVYLDNEELKTGDDLSDLQKAIAESKISIVVFSENYATSTWCLKELVKILECKANQQQIVMPIFYRVDPSDIRKQKGSFAEAFAEHERDRKKDKKEVKSWRSALKEVASIVGCHSKNFGDDAELIDDIVKNVFDKVNWISPHTEDGLVAMDSHLHEMRRLLNAAPDGGVYVVGIWGMGGLGKTTIARAVYDRICHKFDHRFFFQNVREGFTREGEVKMKVEFLSGILNKEVSNFDGGYMKMLKRLGDKKILVVLDDVLDSSQIDTLLGMKRSFGAGSIIIVTTRDEHVVHGFKIYNPKPLSDQDALKLFSQNAFNPDKPSGEYEHLSRCIVEYAHGLPLALTVLGRLLRNRSVSQWKGQFEKLKKYPEPKIKDVLKISYDGLDPSQQDIFLDIACFFKGMHKDCVTEVLVNCDLTPDIDLDVLVERALVTISRSKTLEMHDLLQEMGRQIEKDGKRIRFWGEEAERVLTGKTVPENAERLTIDLPKKEDGSFNTSMRIFTYGQRYSGDDGQNHLTGEFNFLSRELKVLVWHGYPQKCLPSNFDPKNLVQLDMPYSNIEQLWEGSKPAEKLISINLSRSPFLKRIPDLTLATNLKELRFRGCFSLREVHPSISALKNVVLMDLSECDLLGSLPSSIGQMKSLEILDLSHCTRFEMFPEISEVMEALSMLILHDTGIKVLPSSIEKLRGLKSLYLFDSRSLIRLPDSICNLAELELLWLGWCTGLPLHFPMSISNIELLNGSNYKKWKGDIELNLGILDFDHVLREDPPQEPAANASKETKDKYLQWHRHNRMALICMKKSMTDAVKGGIADSENARVFFNSIADKYKVSDKAETGNLMNKLIKMRFNGQGSIREYIMQGIDTAGKLKGLNVTVEDTFLVYLLLNSLPDQYSHLKSLYNTQKEKWSLDELISICVQEETEVLKRGKAITINYMGNPVNYLGKPKFKKNSGKYFKGSSSKNPVKSDFTKGKSLNASPSQVKCFFCKKVGHFKKDCDGFKNWLNKKGIIQNNNPKKE